MEMRGGSRGSIEGGGLNDLINIAPTLTNFSNYNAAEYDNR